MFLQGRRIPTAGKRPPEIGEWIKRAREPSYAPTRPSNQPPEDFLDDWRNAMRGWWSAINPKSRRRDKSGIVGKHRTDTDWSCMHYHGPNGFLSILKGLKWWFDMEGKAEGGAEWLEILDDVQFALGGLLKLLRYVGPIW
ncbi:hypothetical protein HDZ31DRAFT_39926 [Schizophyllum fasciatum]